jgi:YD repeat-containing protein
VRQITNVTDDQGNVTSVTYDLFGRRTAINSPDADLTTFTYDLADNLTANLRAAGKQVTFAYQFNRGHGDQLPPAFPRGRAERPGRQPGRAHHAHHRHRGSPPRQGGARSPGDPRHPDRGWPRRHR